MVTAQDVLGEPEMARRLATTEAVRARLAELTRGVRVEHLAMHTEPVFTPESLAAASPVDRAMLDRGVSMRVVGLPAEDDAYGAAITGLGARNRVSPSVPFKLMVLDRRTAIVPVDPLDHARGAYEITVPSLVDACVRVFEQAWARAVEPAGPPTRPEVRLTPREQLLVQLLAAGHTDQQAARRLGVSVRTVAYLVRGLMDRYAVNGRFQLGLALAAATEPHPPRSGKVATASPRGGSR